MKRIVSAIILVALTITSAHTASIWEKYNLKKTKEKKRTLGRITSLKGDVKIKKFGRAEIEDARVGDIIHEGDIITQYAGTSKIRLNNGEEATLTDEAEIYVDRKGFHLENGKAEFSSGNRVSNIDTGFSTVTSKNSRMKAVNGADGFPASYFADDDLVSVSKGNVLVKVPPGIDKFDIFYENSDKEVQADRFILKQDETAFFDGEKVTIVSKQEKEKPPIERDTRVRHYYGGEIDFAYISRTLENAPSSSEQMLISRLGINYTMMRRRIDPMYSFTFTTDPEMEELKFEYIYPRADRFAESIFSSTPYYKFSVGVGNTHGDGFSPTHSSLGVGYGWLKKMYDVFLLGDFFLFADFNAKKRFWEFDRDGDSGVRDQKWDETELSFETKILYRYR